MKRLVAALAVAAAIIFAPSTAHAAPSLDICTSGQRLTQLQRSLCGITATYGGPRSHAYWHRHRVGYGVESCREMRPHASALPRTLPCRTGSGFVLR